MIEPIKNPLFDEYFNDMETKAAQRRSTDLILGRETPDLASESVQLGQELNMPPSVIMGSPEPFRQKSQQMQGAQHLTKAPLMSDWLGDTINGTLAKDDLENLTWFEKWAANFSETMFAAEDVFEETQFGRGMKTGFIGAEQMGTAIKAVPLQGISQNMLANIEMFNAATDLELGMDRVDIASTLGIDPMSTAAALAFDFVNGDEARRQHHIDRVTTQLLASEENRTALFSAIDEYKAELQETQGRTPNFSDISDAKEFADWFSFNTGQAIPFLAISAISGLIAGGSGLVASGYAMGVGDIQSELIQQGEFDSAGVALAGGVPYAGLELLGPIARQFRGVSGEVLERVAEGWAKRAGKEVGASVVEEFINEAGQEIVKDFAVEAGGGEEVVIDDKKLTAWFDAGMAGTVGGFSVSAGSQTASLAIEKLNDRITAAQFAGRTAAVLDEIDTQAAESLVKDRSPDKFFEALEASGAGDKLMYVPAEGLQEYFQVQGAEVTDESLQDWGIDPADYAEKLVSGGEVAVPSSNYAARISGTDDAAWFRDNATFDPDEMSVADSIAFNEEVSEVMEIAFKEAEEQRQSDDEMRASDVQIFDNVLSMLRVAGRSPDVARNEALVMTAFWRTLGERTGIDALELANSMGLQILGPQTPEVSRRRDALDVQINTLRARGEAALAPSGVSLSAFVAAEGGIQDVGGDVAALELERGVVGETREEVQERQAQPTLEGVPAEGRGVGLDEMGRRAVEAGYFPDLLGEVTGRQEGEAADLGAALLGALGGDPLFAEGEGPDAAMQALSDALSDRGIDISTATNDEIVAALSGDPEGQMFQVDDIESSDAFRTWAGTDDPVIDPNEINETDFSGDGPFVMRAFHGTTHDFEQFDASIKGTKEGQFGAVNYFTSSEDDASQNYGGEGPDLTGRIERVAEPLTDELTDVYKDMGENDAAFSTFIAGEYGEQYSKIEDIADIATAVARDRVAGAGERVLEVYVRTEKPFVVGDGSPWIDFVDFVGLEDRAVRQVAEDNGITFADVQTDRDDYQDQIDDARWELESEIENPLIEAIQSVATRYDADASEIFNSVVDIQTEGTTTSELEEILRASEGLAYAEDPDTAELVGYHMLGEIIEELGFDSIILKNADDRFATMQMEGETTHVHVFDRNNTNIKSVENLGAFDITDPRILFQGDPSVDVGGFVWGDDGQTVTWTPNENEQKFIDELVENGGENTLEELVPSIDYDGTDVVMGRSALSEMHELIGELKDADGPMSIPPRVRRFFQEKRGSIVLPRGGLSEGETVINLFESADLSTFLHESGHFFLEAFTELATVDGAPQSLTDDLAVIHKFLDVEEGATLTTEQHETWARGFEAYLMEGKAPSLELADAFSRFKSWLSRIYRSIRSLNVKITPEIREVMDRMLATDEQIEATRSDMEMKPLFSEGAPAGMSDADFKTYQRMARRSAEQAEQRLLERTMLKIRREKEAWFKAEKKAVRVEVEESTNRKPEYRLTEMLGNQRWLGETDQEIPDMQIDRDELVEIFGEGVLPEINRTRLGGKRAIYGKNAENPEAVADFFGFKSATEMIDVLQNTPKRMDAIATEVDRIMVERHGDPLNDGSIEEEATIAVHSEQQVSVSVAEARALGKQLKRNTANMKSKIYRQQARTMISQMNVHEASRPAAFLKSERKAGRDAERAFAKVARDGRASEQALIDALQAKERQILNGFLYQESLAFEKELQRGRERMREYSKKSVRKKLEGGYIEQIDALLERFDFRVRSQKQVQRDESLVQYADRMIEEGREGELNLDSRLLDESRRTHYTKLSVEDLRGLFDSIANIDHMGRFKKKLIEAKRKRDLDESVEILTGQVRENLGTAGAKSKSVIRSTFNLLFTTDTMLVAIDGGEEMGPAYDEIKLGIDEGQNVEQGMQVDLAENMDDLFSNAYTAKELAAMQKAKDIPGANGRAWTKLEILSAALNTGNADNIQRLLDPTAHEDNRLTRQQLDALLDTLGKRDWDFVQSLWDLIDSYWPQLSEVSQRRTGVKPVKVEAKPIVNQHGTFRGGYYPIQYDPELSAAASIDEQSAWDKFVSAGRGANAAVKNGMTKERGKSGNGRTLRLDMTVPFSHLRDTIRLIALSEAVDNSYRILNDRRVVQSFMDAGRKNDLETMNLWLKDTARGPVFNTDPLNTFARMVKNNFTLSRLAFNMKTVALQVTGLGQSAATIGKKNMILGMLDYRKRPLQLSREIAARSAFMAERKSTFQKDIYDFVNDVSISSPIASRWAKTKGMVGKWGFAPIVWTQFYTVDMPTWLGAYRAGLEKFNDEDRAVHFADRMVARSQDSGLMADRAAVERGTVSESVRQADFIRLFTTLGGYMLKKMNRGYVTTIQAKARIKEADTAGAAVVAASNAAFDMVMLYFFEAALMGLIYSIMADDDIDEEDLRRFVVEEVGMAVVGGIPLLRDAASAFRGFGGGGVYGSVLEIPANVYTQAVQGEVDKGLRRALADLVGTSTGLPTTAPMRLIEGFLDDDIPPAEMFFGFNPLTR